MEDIKNILDYSFSLGKDSEITVRAILMVVIALIATSIVLNFLRKLVTRKLPEEDKVKFVSVFGYLKWVIYLVIFLITLHTGGVNITAIFAASAALLIGVGLALQTLFQDIISGIFILIDQSVHVGDIIELEGKVGRVEEIKLRTTRAVTVDNKVIIIPNHLYLTNSLYNWTENGTETRECVSVGVAYGSDTALVKKILLSVANDHKAVFKNPEPVVLFEDFGDSALQFKLCFSLNDSFQARGPKSDMRFEIDRRFREAGISIPFPQRDLHIIKS
ncbi:mechanosensitive ion channel [Flavobacteriaceae bacterium F08102]|nr:mechanosensitive ion channel [Flavobacteriaceae bacterium F08102]